MCDLKPDLSSSPGRVSNFVISCSESVSLNRDDAVGLLNFLHENTNSELNNIDSAFFPRAFTDTDLLDEEKVESDRIQVDKEVTTMDGSGGSFIQPGYQPDVVMVSSFQRPGPDGSPALVSSRPQGFRSATNASETSELFAPVRALNFSEIDQSSQVESYISEQGRHVSTPEHRDFEPGGSEMNVGLQAERDVFNQHNYTDSGEQAYQYDCHLAERDTVSPEFRQLEADGEADSQMTGTGNFQPMAFGLNQEFMDDYTSGHRSRSLGFGDSVFSPLSTNRYQSEEGHGDRQTPPLHIPGPNSPYSKQCKQASPRPQRLDYNEEAEQQELQFSMSPTRGKADSRTQPQPQPDRLSDDPAAGISQAQFQQRYLQRTQVSVMLPQATYDSLAEGGSEVRREERYPSLPPDSLEEDELQQQSSPERVIDLIQNQVTQLKQIDTSDDSARRFVQVSDGRSDQDQLWNRANGADNMVTSRSSGAGSDSSRNTSIPQPVRGSRVLDSGNDNQSAVSNSSNNSSISSVESRSSNQLTSKTQVSNQNQKAAKAQSKSATAGNMSSRVLQETASQKNKVCSKFVPSTSKPAVTVQSKDQFKRPHDVHRGPTVGGNGNKSQTTASAGGRRTLPETDARGAKPKTTMHTSLEQTQKSKSAAAPTLQKPRQQGSLQTSKSRMGSQGPGGNTHSHESTQGTVRSSGLSLRQNTTGQSSGDLEEEEGHRREDPIVTQVEQTSPVCVEKPLSRLSQNDPNLDVQGMEEVRHQLHSMLRLSSDTMPGADRSQYEHSDILAGHGSEFGQADTREQLINWQRYHQSQEDVSEIIETFPSFTSQFLQSDSGNVSRSDVSLQAENQRLRDLLEKERYRRKHCENYIQQLNVKLLETQQQVAVAVSTDKRKDIMIEQLDKQLAKVVEGWKKRDADKDEVVDKMRQEKEDIEEQMKQQEQMMSQFEKDMSEAVEALRQEKETSAQSVTSLKEEVREVEREKSHAEEVLAAEREKVQLIQQECENLRESREQLDKKLDQMQKRLHREQDDWFQREQELLQRIEEVSEKNGKILQIERTKNEEQNKIAEEVVEKLHIANTQSKRLELELDAAVREKESLKVEMGIMEAKFESSQRVLEADLHSNMEKQIAEHVGEVQSKMERAEDELREKHREQVLALNLRHGKEIEKQLSQFREELHKKEDEFRKQLQELEGRLQEYRNENAELKVAKQKLESQRLEILTKLQYMMQSQWNEALSLLSASSPHRKLRHVDLGPVEGASHMDTDQTITSIPTVNFSLHSPYPTRAPVAGRDMSPHRSPISEIGRDAVGLYSPGQDSVVSHSTAKEGHAVPSHRGNDPIAAGSVDAVETAAALHMKELQDYINSITQTPEWISSLENKEAAASPRSQPNIPTQPNIAALLNSHLQKIQQQPVMSQSALASNQPVNSSEQQAAPFPGSSNQKPSLQQSHTSSPPRSKPANQRTHAQRSSPPRKSAANRTSHTHQGHAEVINQHSQPETQTSQNVSTVYGGESFMSWDGGQNLSQAVPIRPPQQQQHPSMDVYQQNPELSALSDAAYFTQGGQSFSPPTKQSNRSHSQHHHANMTSDTQAFSSIEDESVRLNSDYSQLTERLEQHESNQSDLQHYIQMLLHKCPSEGNPEDQSLYSPDRTVEELDLNDTAQAAQLQRELDRIQELREKQETGQRRGREPVNTSQSDRQGAGNQSKAGQQKILNASEMANVSRLIQQVKSQSEPDNPQIAELLEVLKQIKPQSPQSGRGKQKAGGQKGTQADRHKELAAVKRNLQFPGGKPADNAGQVLENGASKPGKKMERKVAGSVTKADSKGNKPPAWK